MSIEASYSQQPGTNVYYKVGDNNRQTAVIESPGDPTLRVENLRINIFAGRGAELVVDTADGRSFICQVPLREQKEERPNSSASVSQAVGPHLGRKASPRSRCCQTMGKVSGSLRAKASSAAKKGGAVVAHYGPPLVQGVLNAFSSFARAGFYGSKMIFNATHATLSAVGNVTGETLETVGVGLVGSVRIVKRNCPALLGVVTAATAYYAYEVGKYR